MKRPGQVDVIGDADAHTHSPRLVDGPLAARKRVLPEMCQALEITPVGQEEFSPPHRPVRAIAGAIEGDAQHRPFQPALRHDTGDMRVMMLYPDQSDAVQPRRVTCRQVARMQVVGDDLGSHTQKLEPPSDLFLEEGVSGVLRQVADMLRDMGVPPYNQAEGALEVAAGGQHHRGIGTYPQGRRHETPGPPQEPAAATDEPDHRVVTAVLDRPVVGEGRIGDPLS